MIIALTGLAGSGKNTVAEMIGGIPLAFAQPLKEFCGQVFGFSDRQLCGPSEAREEPSPHFTRPDGTPLTARFALQTLGTEWGRNCDPDVWAKAGVRRAHVYAANKNRLPAVITDLRFVNEARLVRESGGQVWRICRSSRNAVALHASERDVWSPEMSALVTHEIANAGTLEQLAVTVRAALESGI